MLRDFLVGCHCIALALPLCCCFYHSTGNASGVALLLWLAVVSKVLRCHWVVIIGIALATQAMSRCCFIAFAVIVLTTQSSCGAGNPVVRLSLSNRVGRCASICCQEEWGGTMTPPATTTTSSSTTKSATKTTTVAAMAPPLHLQTATPMLPLLLSLLT
jgi:hypothetical protein